MTSTYNVDEVSITYKRAIDITLVKNQTAFMEEDRFKMKVKDQNDLNDKIMSTFIKHKFHYFTNLDSPNKGEEVEMIYKHKKTITKLCANLFKYNLERLFTIIKYKKCFHSVLS